MVTPKFSCCRYFSKDACFLLWTVLYITVMTLVHYLVVQNHRYCRAERADMRQEPLWGLVLNDGPNKQQKMTGLPWKHFLVVLGVMSMLDLSCVSGCPGDSLFPLMVASWRWRRWEKPLPFQLSLIYFAVAGLAVVQPKWVVDPCRFLLDENALNGNFILRILQLQRAI